MANVVRFKKRSVAASLSNYYARIYSKADGRIIYAGNGLSSDAQGNVTVDIGEAGMHGQHVNGFAGDVSDFVLALGSAFVSDADYNEGDAPLNKQAANILASSVEEGNAVSSRKGFWVSNDEITYTYQWKLNGTDISGATTGSILTDESMIDGTLTCVVTATNKYGSTSSTTNGVSVTGEGGAPPIDNYDTVVGVGDSISQGEYDLAGGQFDEPFRGVNFRTGAVYGTTIQQMIDNITDFTSQAEGNTLFIVRAGINDCNTYLSAGGVGDGDAGTVLSWDDMTQAQKDSTLTAYRELISLLEQVGDVALGTITYCDAKGQLLPLPDKGRNLHSGSWNDNTTVPLCAELTPDWFDTQTGRPIFDYYQVTYDAPETLDADNLHFYKDSTYLAPAGLGYIDGPGSYTIRQHTIAGVGEYTAMSATPFDNSLFSNRILINVGRGNGLIGRPSYQRWANNLELSAANEVYENLNSYNGATNVTLTANFSSNGGAVANISTTGQVWSEGAGDTNNCSSGFYTGSGTLTHEISGVSKGIVSMVGIFSSSGAGGTYDPTLRTVFEVEDDNGLRTVEAPSSIDGDIVTIADCTAYIDFDCSIGGLLKITPRKAVGSQYGTISSICIDLE